MALVDGMYGSKTNDTSLIKLMIVAMTVLLLKLKQYYLFDSMLCFYQNLESWRYLLPKCEIYIAIFNPSLISTASRTIRYFLYLSSITFKKSIYKGVKFYRLIFGIYLPKLAYAYSKARLQRLPTFAKSSLLFLSINYFQLNSESDFYGLFTSK